MKLRFYGEDERAMRSGLHGAVEELTATVPLIGTREHTMKTQASALAFIARAIEAGNANAEDFDLDAIADTLHNIAGGWDISDVYMSTFWRVVADNAVPRPTKLPEL